MKKLKSIKEELADCRAAFAAAKVLGHAWCCHHRVRTEALSDPPEVRIQYILNSKPRYEHAIRLRNFRPVRVSPFLHYLQARVDYERQRMECERAQAACDLAWVNYRENIAEWKGPKHHQLWTNYHQIRAVYERAWETYKNEMGKFHDSDWPCNTWDKDKENIFSLF